MTNQLCSSHTPATLRVRGLEPQMRERGEGREGGWEEEFERERETETMKGERKG